MNNTFQNVAQNGIKTIVKFLKTIIIKFIEHLNYMYFHSWESNLLLKLQEKI